VPELPEVETTARVLQATILGATIVDIDSIDWPRMLPNATVDVARALLTGRTVCSVGRRGKYLLIELLGDVWLVVHRKMSGNVLLLDPGADTPRHTHFRAVLDDGRSLVLEDARKFGRVHVFADGSTMREKIDRRLGPEPLTLDTRGVTRLLAGRSGRIKSLLLDQAVFAGVGNLYADEALWLARIHPLRAADSLSSAERGRLISSLRHVLEAAIGRRGTSLSDYVDALGQAGDNQNYLEAYGRDGQPCSRCGRSIQRIVVGQRGTWHCPRCQRPRPRSFPRTAVVAL
jgi:formamidopyrimidine-DNA glycosylase